ncbi:CGNR zinc finger domain-containing protein [Streptomyces sp. DSM 44917]|uniref:CGNR zinc finger domain-containing protein n=1 Tax=Streptomyces boetiae TaxID=3075541 RepID=A0ABU2LC41_9ACTN|nr:CGNR zinc finger domain-containing protein [Streptomyces sp. DSM 44917]MDT0309152.1 CGNR zinc finger domain-containing protein [Streptomyces sp. DSM 44917]
MSVYASAPAGLVLRASSGVSFRFDPGALCLELLPTGGPGPLARWEVLRAPADLVAWAESSRLDPTPRLTVSPQDVAAARRLRDALWRAATALAGGLPPAPGDLAEVNAAAARPSLVPALAPDGTLAWAGDPDGRALLSTVARDAVRLFTGPHAGRVRECAGENCALVFVDTSRPGRRRWCSMERCGNRHKVRALRARRSEEG